MAGRGRGRARRRAARRPLAPLHARGALPEGQPLPRRASTAPGRVTQPLRRIGAKGEGASRRSAGTRRSTRRPPGCARDRARTAPSRCSRTTSPAPRAWCRAGSWARACSPRSAPRACRRRSAPPPRGAALRATYGGSVGMDPEDFEYAQLVILWGANLLSTNLHQWRFVLAAQRRGAHVVAIDPLRTDTAERCDEHLAPRPGTDAALALGLMRVVLDEGAEDREWLDALQRGLARARGAPGRVAGRARGRDLRAPGRERASRSAGGSRTRGRRPSASASACSGTAAPVRRCARSSPCPR